MKVSKNVARVFSVLMIIFVLCSTLMPVFADGEAAGGTKITIPTGGDTSDANPGAKAANSIGNIILGTVKVIAGFAAVILLIVLAIKYMTSSPEGKADIKKTAIIYVVGAIVLFGASWILDMIQKATNSVES